MSAGWTLKKYGKNASPDDSIKEGVNTQKKEISIEKKDG